MLSKNSYSEDPSVPKGREHLFASFNPDAVRAALKKAAGAWPELDDEAMIADLYRAREKGSRPDAPHE